MLFARAAFVTGTWLVKLEETLAGKLHRKLGYPDTRSLLAVAVLAVAVIAIAASVYWWGIRDTNTTPTSDINTTTSPTPKPTGSQPAEQPPPMPQTAKQNTLDGIRAFVVHYFDLANYAQRTNNAEPLKAVQQEEQCEGCKYQIQLFEDLKKDKQRIVGGEYKFKNVAIARDRDVYVCVSDFGREVAYVVDANGQKVEDSSRDNPNATLVLGVRWLANSWQIIRQSYDE